MKLIKPDEVTLTARITEAEVKARLEAEMLEQIGGLDPATGQKLPGVSVKVLRGPKGTGGYTITATGPAPKRLALPHAQEG